MLQFEIGVVKRFFNAPGALYGFLKVVDENGRPVGPDLFFHYYSGKYVKLDEASGEVVFAGAMSADTIRIQRGDRLAFVRGRNGKGEVARKWTKAEDYENLIRNASSPYCRLVMVYLDEDGLVVREEGWRGTLDELNQTYPVSVLPGRKLNDPLIPDGEWSYEFEVWHGSADDPNGHWAVVPDPRTYSETARRLIEERDAITAKSVDA